MKNQEPSKEICQEYQEIMKILFKKKFGIPLDAKIILFAGRISEDKGGKQIIYVMEKVIQKVPNAYLVVMGKKEGYGEEMMKLAEELGIKKHIIFTGWLNKD